MGVSSFINYFEHKVSMKMLLLILLVFFIFLHTTVRGCCHSHGFMEGLENNSKTTTSPTETVKTLAKNKIASKLSSSTTSSSTPAATSTSTTTTSSLPATSTLPVPVTPPTSVHSASKKEGFVGSNTNYGESASYSLHHVDAVDTSKWGLPSLTVKNGNQSAGARAIMNRPNQSFPLPEGQLSMFDNMPFSPECCPNAFSSSMGCACMNSDTYNYLISRGGNNVPYSEY